MTDAVDPQAPSEQVPSAKRREEVRLLWNIVCPGAYWNRGIGQPWRPTKTEFWSFLTALDAQSAERTRAAIEAVRSELLALMDERIEHVKENVAALAKYQDSMDPGYSEPRCRELAALYLSEIRMMFAGWPEKPIPPSSIDTRLRAEVEKMREAAATSAIHTITKHGTQLGEITLALLVAQNIRATLGTPQ